MSLHHSARNLQPAVLWAAAAVAAMVALLAGWPQDAPPERQAVRVSPPPAAATADVSGAQPGAVVARDDSTAAARTRQPRVVHTTRFAVVRVREDASGGVATVMDRVDQRVLSVKRGERIVGLRVLSVSRDGVDIDHGTFVERIPPLPVGTAPTMPGVIAHEGPYDDENAGHHGM